MTSIPIAIGTMAMPDPATNRLFKRPLPSEFTRIYISFYNSFTISGNLVGYVCPPVPNMLAVLYYDTRQYVRAGIGEVKTILHMKLYQNRHIRL